MDNRQRDALGLPRKTNPGPLPLLKVTPADRETPIIISQQRIDRVVPHEKGSLIIFSDESQMVVKESMDTIISMAG